MGDLSTSRARRADCAATSATRIAHLLNRIDEPRPDYGARYDSAPAEMSKRLVKRRSAPATSVADRAEPLG